MQALLAQLVLVGFLFLVTYVRPYDRPVDNHLQMFSVIGAAALPYLHLCRWLFHTLLLPSIRGQKASEELPRLFDQRDVSKI